MRTLLTLALCGLAAPALAAPWTIDPSSTLSFTGTQASERFTGHFTKFTPVVDFDPLKPELGKITVTVDMTSATIGDKDKQDSLPTEDWFFVEQFPTATFTSTRITSLSSSKSYIAEGDLTLRGVSKKVNLPFTLREENGTTYAEGKLTLNRSDFAIGQGQWKSDEWVKYPVDVTFHLKATP